jgi:HD-GYP domain-containing protein (c-di-GMP phosphodiesterase class II)
VFWEGTALDSLESVDSRRFLPPALLATLIVIVAPALVVVALSPLSGIADLLLSALLATGLSVAAGSAGAALWTRLPQSREIPFSDLMLWAWVRRVRAERRLAKTATGEPAAGAARELAALRRLAVVFEARDGFNYGHSGRVARHAERIARRLGLPEDEVDRIEAAASVHDIGMVRVPRSVLTRRDELSTEERGLVQRHALHGAEQVEMVGEPEIAALVRHQHENVDGSGYPDGLAGDEIPLGARIIAVADRFDELQSAGPQRAPRSRRNALDELSARGGTELDAAVVAAFVAYYSGSRSIAGVALAATAPQRAVRWIAAAPATIGTAGAPVAVQTVCAAGTAALATACLTGMPALTPEREDRKPAVQQRADRAPAGGGHGVAAGTQLAGAPDGTTPERRADGRDRRGSGGGDGTPAPPSSERAPAPTGGGGGQGGGGTPTTPQTGTGNGGGGGGGTQPSPDTGGGSSPGTPAPTQPTAPAPTPPVTVPQIPQTPVAPASQVLDPVLDGVGNAVPPVKPVTEAVKNLLGGLTGGGQGR